MTRAEALERAREIIDTAMPDKIVSHPGALMLDVTDWKRKLTTGVARALAQAEPEPKPTDQERYEYLVAPFVDCLNQEIRENSAGPEAHVADDLRPLLRQLVDACRVDACRRGKDKPEPEPDWREAIRDANAHFTEFYGKARTCDCSGCEAYQRWLARPAVQAALRDER